MQCTHQTSTLYLYGVVLLGVCLIAYDWRCDVSAIICSGCVCCINCMWLHLYTVYSAVFWQWDVNFLPLSWNKTQSGWVLLSNSKAALYSINDWRVTCWQSMAQSCDLMTSFLWAAKRTIPLWLLCSIATITMNSIFPKPGWPTTVFPNFII